MSLSWLMPRVKLCEKRAVKMTTGLRCKENEDKEEDEHNNGKESQQTM